MKRLLQIIETMSGALFAVSQRLQGRSIGRRTRTLGRWPRVRGRGSLKIGSVTKFFGRALRVVLDVSPGGILTIGDRCALNDGASIFVSQSVSIGDGTLLARNVQIMDSSGHETDEGSGARTLPVQIGRNVWIGTGAIVLPGVTIGDHSVVGAGSVVTKSIPARVVAAGNPCKVIRTLNASPEYVRR